MATLDDIELLKRLTNDLSALDDIALGALIDRLTINGAAAQIWREQAAATVSLVDISESGSSRKMSDVHKNALKMAEYFQGLVDGEVEVATRRTQIKRIVRA